MAAEHSFTNWEKQCELWGGKRGLRGPLFWFPVWQCSVLRVQKEAGCGPCGHLEETAAVRWSGQGAGVGNGRTQSSGPHSIPSWITWDVSLNLSGPERGWLSN